MPECLKFPFVLFIIYIFICFPNTLIVKGTGFFLLLPLHFENNLRKICQ